eukprot:COSAG01_NODE_73157_length_251_cov_0.611842_1_plen_64_part_10
MKIETMLDQNWPNAIVYRRRDFEVKAMMEAHCARRQPILRLPFTQSSVLPPPRQVESGDTACTV